MKFSKLIVLGLSIGLMVVACKKDDDPTTTTPTTNTKAKLALHIDHKFNNETFALDQNFTLGGGEIVKFSVAQFYISNIRLMDDDQNMTPFTDKFLLIKPSVSHAEIGEMEAHHYHMIMLNLGIDSITNVSKQPTDFADGHPLAAQLPGMWWSWAAGYIFYKLEGQIDIDADGTFDDSFEYHIGTNPNLIAKQKMLHTNAAAGEELMVHMKVDYAKFFDNLDLSTELQAHMGPPLVVAKIVTNTSNAITFE